VALAIDGVIRDVVETADCGFFATPGNAEEIAEAIHKLAADATQSRAMGLKGRKYLEENFSRAVIGEKLIKLLEEIISAPEGS
jgi:glycosyltransferase involved in cell wall biosynthesis